MVACAFQVRLLFQVVSSLSGSRSMGKRKSADSLVAKSGRQAIQNSADKVACLPLTGITPSQVRSPGTSLRVLRSQKRPLDVDERVSQPSISESPVVAGELALGQLGTFNSSDVDIDYDHGTDGSRMMDQVLRAVVKVFVTSTSPNYAMPWQMKHQHKSTASGFVIEGRRILTNAHAVAHHTLVMVRKHGNPKKYVAKVEAIGHECDMALMTVAEEEFWNGVVHLELSTIPQLQEVVTVVGYPTGGDNVSVTKGVVSRLEMQQYSHAACSLLAIQIDAAINSGNSGGPALKDDKVIGIAFETLECAENIGYIIPVPVIHHFLEDIQRHGLYTGFCDLGIYWQIMENADMREFYRMAKEHTGILINRLQPLSKAQDIIKPGDLLLAFDDVPIADDGTVPFRGAERIEFAHLVAHKFLGDTCRVRLLREGKVVEAEAPLSSIKPLVPVHLYDLEGPPGYLIYAGLVFVQCSQPFLRAQYGKEWENKAPYRLCEKAASGTLDYEEQEVVLLSQVLAAEINNGYQSITSLEVTSVNNEPVRNLQHLARLVLENKEQYLCIEFDKQKKVVLNVAKANAVSDDVLAQNYISSAYSTGLLDEPPGGVRAQKVKEAVAAAAAARQKEQEKGAKGSRKGTGRRKQSEPGKLKLDKEVEEVGEENGARRENDSGAQQEGGVEGTMRPGRRKAGKQVAESVGKRAGKVRSTAGRGLDVRPDEKAGGRGKQRKIEELLESSHEVQKQSG